MFRMMGCMEDFPFIEAEGTPRRLLSQSNSIRICWELE